MEYKENTEYEYSKYGSTMYRINTSAVNIGSLGYAGRVGDSTIQPNLQNHGLHKLNLDMTEDMIVISSQQLLESKLSLMNMLNGRGLLPPPAPSFSSIGMLSPPRPSIYIGGMNAYPSMAPLESHSPFGIHNVNNITIENSRESLRFSAETSWKTRENVVLDHNHDRYRKVTSPFNFDRALRAFRPSHREKLRMGSYRGISIPTESNRRSNEIMRSNHYHGFQQPLHPPPFLPLQERCGGYVEQQLVPNGFHQKPQAFPSSRGLVHSPHTSYPQPQVPYSPFEAMDEILNGRQPGEETFEPFIMITEGHLLGRTQNVSSMSHMLARTQNYHGEGTRGSNQDGTIPVFLSCAIWIVEIPPEATHYDVLDAIHLQGTGRVFSSFLNNVDENHPKKVAKIVFTTVEAARLIIDQASSSDGLRISGQKILIRQSRHRYHTHHNLSQSRAIRVSGPPDLVNFQALIYFWSKNVRLDILDVRVVSSSPYNNVIDWFFGSILGQSVAAKLAIEKERGLRERGIRVRYRSDPCEW